MEIGDGHEPEAQADPALGEPIGTKLTRHARAGKYPIISNFQQQASHRKQMGSPKLVGFLIYLFT